MLNWSIHPKAPHLVEGGSLYISGIKVPFKVGHSSNINVKFFLKIENDKLVLFPQDLSTHRLCPTYYKNESSSLDSLYVRADKPLMTLLEYTEDLFTLNLWDPIYLYFENEAPLKDLQTAKERAEESAPIFVISSL